MSSSTQLDASSCSASQPSPSVVLLPRITPRPTKVGLVAGGLGAYWPQFPDLLPQLQRSAARVAERMRRARLPRSSTSGSSRTPRRARGRGDSCAPPDATSSSDS